MYCHFCDIYINDVVLNTKHVRIVILLCENGLAVQILAENYVIFRINLSFQLKAPLNQFERSGTLEDQRARK